MFRIRSTSYFSCLSPITSPAAPITPPRNKRKDWVSGRDGSVFGGQSTMSPSAMRAAPRPTSIFQRSATPYDTPLSRARRPIVVRLVLFPFSLSFQY
jgi:hypothetical protein